MGSTASPADSRRCFSRPRHQIRGEDVDGCRQVVQTRDMLGQIAQVDQILREQDVGDCEEEEGVRAGADEDVLVRRRRGLGPSRVHHDDLAPACPDRLESPWPVRCGGQAAVRWARSRSITVNRAEQTRRPASSLITMSKVQIVRPMWIGVDTPVTRPSVADR